MAKVHDVAAYIISKVRNVDAMKLQKLLYYAQAWSLVWDKRPLFSSTVEAWANGPVVREVFKAYQGQYKIAEPRFGNKDGLNPNEKQTVDAILKFYGPKTGFYLSQLTHRERPWMDARKGLAPGDFGCNEITKSAMLEYYGSLV
ncbi:MAG TPA: type II toxin-antitoxin system antitoxin SocA domain-containing protein [Terracidiphilus sp.]|nr:type II toxin-antitoxin system antitoxin SocA domain-containing protein [Terracidiphilus sp.]